MCEDTLHNGEIDDNDDNDNNNNNNNNNNNIIFTHVTIQKPEGQLEEQHTVHEM
jgi:hypothetical protein